MQVHIEREIYIRASRCYDLLNDSIQLFKKYLEEATESTDANYYKSRNFLKEGKGFFEQTLRDAKKLLGPIPIYASPDFEEWRDKVLVENKIVVHGETLEALKTELAEDEFIVTLMSREDIEAYLDSHFEAQKTGKRKLANIKIRMILDKLALLIREAQELQKEAQRKHQGLPA